MYIYVIYQLKALETESVVALLHAPPVAALCHHLHRLTLALARWAGIGLVGGGGGGEFRIAVCMLVDCISILKINVTGNDLA